MRFFAREEATVFLCKRMIEGVIQVNLGVVNFSIQGLLLLGAVAVRGRQSSAKLFEVAGCFLAFCGLVDKRGPTISRCTRLLTKESNHMILLDHPLSFFLMLDLFKVLLVAG